MITRYSLLNQEDCIAATATPPGTGALAIIRVSGKEAILLASKVFTPAAKGVDITEEPTHTVHYGYIYDSNELVDEVMVSIFREPKSYTGENAVEISCHGSEYIQKTILSLLLRNGARLANPGEFTLRAFLKGRFDLSGAEAVADLIASQSKRSHDLAIGQMRGGFSRIIGNLRKQLLDMSSLLELELDFSEEDVEFADRSALMSLLNTMETDISGLLKSFSMGNVISRGIPVAIAGKPNSGKSTLLNALLNEERAIVSEIPGTTRDAIEDTVTYEGITFRFIDTAGLRHTEEQIEAIGIERTWKAISKALVVLYIFDISETAAEEILRSIGDIKSYLQSVKGPDEPAGIVIPVANKIDLLVESPQLFTELVGMDCIFISAKRLENINMVISRLLDFVNAGMVKDQTILTNVRHFDALNRVMDAIVSVRNSLVQNRPTDLVAADLRSALHYLGEITGEITTDEVLGNIFSKFCIGK